MAVDNYTLSEYAGLGGRVLAREGGTPVPGGTITINTSTSSASAPVSPGHYRLVATAATFVSLGVGSATAVVDSDMYLPANVPTMIFVGMDENNRQYTHIAGVLSSGTGKLYVTPMKA
jgi:hypothetical protein